MSPVLVEVTGILVYQAFQVPFVENDHVVEQVPAAVANPTLGNTVLPRTSETFRFGWMPKLFTVLTTSSLKLAPRSKIK